MINIDEGMWVVFGGLVNVLINDINFDNGMGSMFFDCLVGLKKV